MTNPAQIQNPLILKSIQSRSCQGFTVLYGFIPRTPPFLKPPNRSCDTNNDTRTTHILLLVLTTTRSESLTETMAEKAETDVSTEVERAVVTFKSLGVHDAICEAVKQLQWKEPSEIQAKAIPEALKGSDIVGLAETGSGKTGAFAIPILQGLLENPQRLFAVVLAPTRELAFQINEVFEALGAAIALHTVCIVGGIDMITQAIALAKKPHIIGESHDVDEQVNLCKRCQHYILSIYYMLLVATPGRLVDHLQNTKGFSLRNLKYLVMDEADRMLSMDFEEELNKILAVIPRERRTFLFSATMTSKVAKLQRASLIDPVKVEVSNKFQTPKVYLFTYILV